MASKKIVNGRAYYTCSECSFAYESKKLADKCEAWCRANNSCNLEITAKAVKLPG